MTIDGEPILFRGVTYSPTPIGKDQSAQLEADRIYDFFSPGSADLWERDLPMMRDLGLNTVRVYELRGTVDHTKFLDMALALNITVFAGFPLDESMNLASGNAPGTASSNPLDVNLADVKVRLGEAVRANHHPAVGMWLVGNEVNLGKNRFVCDVTCKFMDNTEQAYLVMNELCAEVEANGYPCTSPLADTALPYTRYSTDQVGWKDFVAHVRLLESRMTHFAVWMVNVYRGVTFGDLFKDYAKVSGKPLLIGEYGTDAYNSVTHQEDEEVRRPDCELPACAHHFAAVTHTPLLPKWQSTCHLGCGHMHVTVADLAHDTRALAGARAKHTAPGRGAGTACCYLRRKL